MLDQLLNITCAAWQTFVRHDIKLSDLQSLVSILIGLNVASPLYLGLLPNVAGDAKRSHSVTEQTFREQKAEMEASILNYAAANDMALLFEEIEEPDRIDAQLAACIQWRRPYAKKFSVQLAQIDVSRTASSATFKEAIDGASVLQNQLPRFFPTFVWCAAIQFFILVGLSVVPEIGVGAPVLLVLFVILSGTSFRSVRLLMQYARLVQYFRELADSERSLLAALEWLRSQIPS